MSEPILVPPGGGEIIGGPARFLDIHTPSCGFGAQLRRLHEGRTEDAEGAFDQMPAQGPRDRR